MGSCFLVPIPPGDSYGVLQPRLAQGFLLHRSDQESNQQDWISAFARKECEGLVSENGGRDARYDYLYNQFELFEITERIRLIAKETEEAYVITNNHYHGKAVCNALEIKAKLGERDLKIPDVLLQHYPQLQEIQAEEE